MAYEGVGSGRSGSTKQGQRLTPTTAAQRTNVAPAPAPAPAPARTIQPGRPRTAAVSSGGGGGGSYGGGGGSYGGGGGDVGMDAMAAVASPPPPSKDDFLNSDDVYLAALSRYNKQFDDLDADITRRRGDYQTTFDNSVRDLGRLSDGSWDFQNQQTAAGRGFQSLIQDFAARGLLNSGDYLRASDDLKSNLGRQYTGMNDARSQFNEGLNSERNAGVSARDGGQGQARAEALARYAQMYGAV